MFCCQEGWEEWTGSLRRVLDKANQRSTKSTFGFKLVRDRKHDHKPLKWGEKSGKSPLFWGKSRLVKYQSIWPIIHGSFVNLQRRLGTESCARSIHTSRRSMSLERCAGWADSGDGWVVSTFNCLVVKLYVVSTFDYVYRTEHVFFDIQSRIYETLMYDI